MNKKKFKRGDLVEYDFGLGVVLDTEVRQHRKDVGHFTVCKILFCDGIEWHNVKALHEPGPFLRMVETTKKINKKLDLEL